MVNVKFRLIKFFLQRGGPGSLTTYFYLFIYFFFGGGWGWGEYEVPPKPLNSDSISDPRKKL